MLPIALLVGFLGEAGHCSPVGRWEAAWSGDERGLAEVIEQREARVRVRTPISLCDPGTLLLSSSLDGNNDELSSTGLRGSFNEILDAKGPVHSRCSMNLSKCDDDDLSLKVPSPEVASLCS